MFRARCWAAYLLTALTGIFTPSAAQPGGPAPVYSFPAASPESVGLSTEALKALDAAAQGYVDRDEAVGAELMVIKDRKTVWHTAHGLADREQRTALKTGSIYCVRSMTKPFVGTAVQMLIDEGKLSLSDHAAKYLPRFDSDSHRGITIAHLLTHTSGLPLSSLLAVDHRSLKGVQEVASLAAGATLQSTPGEKFSYSDDGTDTLTAIIEKVSGRPAEEFIQARILTPLGMSDAIPLLKAGDPRRARMIPLYGGSSGAWSRVWSPDQDALFPYFLGSQSMYCTCEDYARFLCLWADGGVAGGTRLLSKEAIDRGLTPANQMGYPCGFTGVRADYGQLWMTWVEPGRTPPARVAFGHGGSDGTVAWIWPEKELIILYFTQSRGGLSSLSIEAEIDQHLFGGASNARQPFAPVLGVYWDAGKQMYRAVVERGGKLHIEVPGQFFGALAPGAEADRWAFELDKTAEISFVRGPDQKVAAVELISGGKVVSRCERVAPDASLPSADAVVEKVLAAHGTVGADGMGAVLRTGSIDMPALKRHMTFTNLVSGPRMRIEVSMNGAVVQTTISDEEHVWTRTGAAKAERASAVAEEQTLLEHPWRAFGDWRKSFAQVQVVGRTSVDGTPALVVRCIPRKGYPAAMLVDEQSGLLLGVEKQVVIPGLGVVGASVRHSDFRDVGGVKLPFKSETTFASPMLGKSFAVIDSAQVGAATSADSFADPTKGP